MSSRRVHFSTPLETPPHGTSAGEYHADGLKKQSLAEWWGNFVLIDQWTPPRVRRRFPDLQFRRYNMAPETRIETIGDLGDSTPDRYDQACSGLDEYIEELSSMFDEDWAKSRDPALLLSPTMESADEEEEVDELVDDDSPSYDLGWSNASSEPSDALPLDDGGPVYDLGWGQIAPEARSDSGSSGPDDTLGSGLEDDDPAYDLGWGQTAPKIQSDGTSSGPEDDEPSYDLGWGGFSSDKQPIDEDSAKSEDEDSPAYNLGWGVGATGTNQDVIDLTNDNGLTSQGNNVIDLTRSSPGPMDLDRDESPSGTMEHGSASSAGHFMFHYNRPTMPVVNEPSSPAERRVFRTNCRMKAIGHDMSDQHVHAIVENAVHGLNSDRVPAQILMANRRVLDTFADAQNRVTDIGYDMSMLHRLIQLQRGLLRTVDHVIGSLEDRPQ
ncbi:hypothetical protein F4604DRAFT_1932034 [Suillus subluteus]|nr:hypothetical protein F4604DRAFT_1932034 [Suillus subluteus]